MSGILITNAHIYLPDSHWEQGWLITEGHKIMACGQGAPPNFQPEFVIRTIDANGQVLLPGFIDPHVHGALDYEAMDASVDGLKEMARFYARHGVTGFLPTTWTADRQSTQAVVEMIQYLKDPIDSGASVLGLHLEGPYLNPVRCGAQDTAHIRRVNKAEAKEYLESGVIRLIALAPEFPENLWLVDECYRRGIRVSAGHTAATFAEMKTAVEHGVRQVTHCFNAMTGLSHREPGTVGAAMSLPEIDCELIADNIHVHPAVQKILVSAKGPGSVILITDAVRGAGLPDGEHRLGNRTITVRDGAARLPDGTLAGSTLTMNLALRNVIQATGLPLEIAWPMSSLNAARAIGVSAFKGSLEAGKDADLVILDPNFDAQLTMVAGKVVWETDRQVF